MKVNQLKALYEKNLTFHPPMPATQPIKSVIHHPQNTHSQPPPPASTIIPPVVLQPQPQPQPAQTQKPVLKNADFLNELNKKLMMKSGKSKIVEKEDSHQQQIVNISLPSVPQYPRGSYRQAMAQTGQQAIPACVPQPEELSFDDIMSRAQQRSVFKSSLKARLGINERNPSSKEEQDIFAEWEVERQSEIQSEQKENKEKKLIEKALQHQKAQSQAYRNNKLYSTLNKQEKTKRVDRIISAVFASRSKQFISMKPAPDPLPITVHPIVNCQKEKVINQNIIKKQQPPVAVETGSQAKIVQGAFQSRSMFAMNKEMMNEMSLKIKKRNDMINPPEQLKPPQQANPKRSVSPFDKKKKNFQKFDQA